MNKVLAASLVLLSAAAGADTLVMKSGEKYQLKGPSTHKNGRVTFTTTSNRLYSVKESEVAREISGPPPAAPPQINRTDSRQLGAIAREQRENRGQTAPVAGKSSDKTGTESGRDSKKKKKSAPKRTAPPPPPAESQPNP